MKSDLKNATGDTLKFGKYVDLVHLKSESDLIDLSKLSDVIKYYVVKKIEYDKLVEIFNVIQAADAGNIVKKLTMTKKLVTLK